MKRASLGLLLLSQAVIAEMPISGYYRLQEQAPNYFDVEIVRVQERPLSGDQIALTWTAKIVEVFRTDANLKAGATITIRHNQYREGAVPPPGPAQAPKLKAGAKVPAYLLKAKDGSFSLAKYGRSFEVTPRPAKF